MFNSLTLPFEITSAMFVVAMVAVGTYYRRWRALAWSILAGTILFVPSCAGVKMVIDQFRYGRFEYAKASDAPYDGFIELPPTATDVILFRRDSGHAAEFCIGTDELCSWVREMELLRPDLNPPSDQYWLTTRDDFDPDLLAKGFGATGWKKHESMASVYVTRNDSHGGYQIWHEPETGLTYLNAGYW